MKDVHAKHSIAGHYGKGANKAISCIVIAWCVLCAVSGLCAARSADDHETLSVHGLHIGIDIDDACKTLNRMDWSWVSKADQDSGYLTATPPFIIIEISNNADALSRPAENDVYVIDIAASRKKRAGQGGGAGANTRMPAVITAGADRKVNYICLEPETVNALFHAEDMEAEDFNQEFMRIYNIPGMELWDEGMGWQYVSDNGYRVRIDDRKRLIIDKAPRRAARHAQ